MSRVLSETYNALEEGVEKSPRELFHFWCGLTHWYYNSTDEKIPFKGISYEPTTIKRSPVEYRADLDISRLSISFGSVSHPIVQYIAKNPIDVVWVQVSRIFMDMDDDEAAVIFVGQIKTPSFKGQQSSVECVGFEHFLKQPIPKERYQPQCNHKLFDEGCTLDEAAYKVSDVMVTVDSTKRLLTATEFGLEEDGYWVFGYIEYNGYRRMVLRHEGDVITLAYPLWTIPASGGNVDIWPGCDGNIKTCRDKFDNVDNALSFPDMPFDNPVLWS